MGGATLPVELKRIHYDSRALTVTGQLGDIMQESARIALDHVVADAARYGIDARWFDEPTCISTSPAQPRRTARAPG